MREQRQDRHSRAHFNDWLATLAVAGVLALVAVLSGEGLLSLVGVVLGDPAWHRAWVDQLLADIPLLGSFSGLLGQLGNGRDLFAFGMVLYGLLLIPARRIGPALIARYDDIALRVLPVGDLGPRWVGPRSAAQYASWQGLTEWCFSGAGSGASPFWRPWAIPQVERRFAVAVLTGAHGLGKSHLAEALSRALDGTPLLEACASRQARLRLRLRVKFNDILWWRSRRRDDPWDSGYLVDDPAPRSRLSQFLPRRATLMVADELPAASLSAAITVLNARRAEFRHPLRLLIVATDLPASLGLRWEEARGVWKSDVPALGDVAVFDLADARFRTPVSQGAVSSLS